MNEFRLIGKLPRIQDQSTASKEIFSVSGHHRQSMSHRRSGDQTIHIWQSINSTQPSPYLRFIKTDSEDSALEVHHDFRESFFIDCCFVGILGPDLVNTPAYFSHRQHTQIMDVCRVLLKPSPHGGTRTDTFPHLANHVGIDEKHTNRIHSSNKPWSLRGGLALRGSFRSNIQSSASSVSPTPVIAKRFLILDSFAFLSASTMAAAKIRRCSSSAETPFAAARSFSDLTTSSGIFLTNN